jgi:hypothetical protein
MRWPASGRPSWSRRRRITAGAAAFLALVLAGGAATGYAEYRSVWGSIHRVAVTGLGRRPPSYGSALNILVYGSDSRADLTARQ